MSEQITGRRLTDLPSDQTREAQRTLADDKAFLAELKQQLRTERAAFAAKQAEMETAEGLTDKLQAAARKADPKSAMKASAEFGAHTIRLADLRANFAKAKPEADAKIADLERQIADAEEGVKLSDKAVKNAFARNAVALFQDRWNDENLSGLLAYIAKKFYEAGTNADLRKCLLQIDSEGKASLGPYEIHLTERHEQFENAYQERDDAEKAEAEQPTPEFESTWQKIKASVVGAR